MGRLGGAAGCRSDGTQHPARAAVRLAAGHRSRWAGETVWRCSVRLRKELDSQSQGFSSFLCIKLYMSQQHVLAWSSGCLGSAGAVNCCGTQAELHVSIIQSFGLPAEVPAGRCNSLLQVSKSAEAELAAAAVATQPRSLALWRKHAALQAALGLAPKLVVLNPAVQPFALLLQKHWLLCCCS